MQCNNNEQYTREFEDNMKNKKLITLGLLAGFAGICAIVSRQCWAGGPGQASSSGEPLGLNQGLIAHYPFDVDARDHSGNGRDATLMNSPSFTNGVLGSAIYLVGSGNYFGSDGQYVLLPYIPLTNYPAFTIALWAKIDGINSIGGEALISFGATHLPDGRGFITIYFYLGAESSIHFVSGGPAPSGEVHLTPLPTRCVGNWAHYALVYDHGTLTGFINGQAVATMAGAAVGQSGTTAGLGTHWFPDTPGGVSTGFTGAIDEVRIYSRALSSDGVKALATLPKPIGVGSAVPGAVTSPQPGPTDATVASVANSPFSDPPPVDAALHLSSGDATSTSSSAVSDPASRPSTVAPTPIVANSPADVPPVPTLDYFKTHLTPYGKWIEVSGYGVCWQPDIQVGWRPYYDRGHWEYTDAGWYWQSGYPWGDLAFHYGRWAYTGAYGWIWMPGYEYAPAWVFWRHADADGYIGWAPLPFGALFVDGGWVFRGVRVGIDFDFGLGTGCFAFVAGDHFWDAGWQRFIVPPERLAFVFRRSVIENHYRLDHGRFVHEGLARERMANLTHRDVRDIRLRGAQQLRRDEERHNVEVRAQNIPNFKAGTKPTKLVELETGHENPHPTKEVPSQTIPPVPRNEDRPQPIAQPPPSRPAFTDIRDKSGSSLQRASANTPANSLAAQSSGGSLPPGKNVVGSSSRKKQPGK